MSGGFYRINRDICAKFHLIGREAMVYNSLLYLCARGAYTGSAQDLSDFSFCGGRKTALRMLDRLQEKRLVIYKRISDKLLCISLLQQECSGQNDQLSGQNDQCSGQNGRISKEKSTKKENIIKEIKNNRSSLAKDIKSQLPQQPVFVSVFVPPTWDELVRFATEKNIPQSLYTQFFAYYTANGWTLKRGAKMENWKAVLTYWFEKEKKDAAKTLYQGVYGKATEQEQAAYAGSQYAEYQARKQRERQEEATRQANTETRYCTYEEYRQVAGDR